MTVIVKPDKPLQGRLEDLPLVTPDQAKAATVPSLVSLPSGMLYIHDPERPDRLARMLEDDYDLPD